MSEIPPALSAEEWTAYGFRRENETIVQHEGDGRAVELLCYDQAAWLSENMVTISDTEWGPRALPGLIALANAALPDDDPRKITWAMVDAIRKSSHDIEAEHDTPGSPLYDDYVLWEQFTALDGSADVLASYLPPRT